MENISSWKVATYNTNSIRARIELVTNWLKRESPDVLCLQETKVQDKDFPVEPFQQAGYHVVFRGQKSYAGVAIASRSEPQDVRSGLDGEDGENEARLIRAVIDGIPVVNTYVPQGRDAESEHFQHKLAWLDHLRALFERDYRPDEPLVWAGDFNVAPEPIDVYAPQRLATHVDFHPLARAALERIRAWGFQDVFRRHHAGEAGQYTFWDYRARNPVERGIGWRVDHIWATSPLADRSINAWIDVSARLAERPSDHTFLVAEFGM